MIAPDNASIVYSPGNWDVNGTRAKTVYPGAYFRFACAEATSVVLNFSTTGSVGTAPALKWRIDGSGWTRVPVAATVTIPLPTDNTWARHVVEVVLASVDEYEPRWASQGQHVSLTGIDVDSIRALPRRPRKVLFFGDSITAGHLAAKFDLGVAGGDSTVTWPYLAAEAVGAEAGIVGVGGQGFTTTSPSGIPSLLSAYRYQWSGSALRDLSADMYVIAHGTNDGGGLTQATVAAWLNDALPRFTPGSPVLMMRPFGGNGAAAIQAASAAAGVVYVDTTGWWDPADATESIHPNGYASIVDLAPQLAEVMLANFGGSGSDNLFINVGGEAVGVTQVTLNG